MALLDAVPAGAEEIAAPVAPAAPAAPAAPQQQQSGARTERQAAAAIEELIDWEGTGGTIDNEELSDDESDDDGAGEDQPTGEDGGESEPQDGDKPAAAIEPPASWSAEDKALFAKLPPEAQATIARRESERDRLVQQRTQEIADQRKAFDAERQAIEGQRKQYLDSLQQMLHLAVPEAQQFAAITPEQWQQLAVSDPARYVQLTAARDALRGRLGQVQAEIARVNQEAEQTQKQRLGEFLAEQKAKLVEKVPDFGDPAKAATLTRDLHTYLTGAGFTPEEIGQAADHRLIVLARDAMLYRQAEAARKAADAKKVATPPPRMQRPNAAPSEDGQGRKIEALRDRSRRTGSLRDAALLIENFL